MAEEDSITMSAAPVGRGIHPIPRFATFLRFAPVVATLLVLFALSGDPAPGDAVLGRAVQQTPLGWMLANIGIFLAYPAVMFLVWCAGTASALRARNWPLVAAALLILLALSVNPILKEVVARPRPGAADLIIRRAAGGYGFPSGHTASATLMYGYAALSLAVVTATQVRRLLIAAAGMAIAVIAFERVYDGAHWPSDVAGGFVLGLLLIAGCEFAGTFIATRASRHEPASAAAPDQATDTMEGPHTAPYHPHTPPPTASRRLR